MGWALHFKLLQNPGYGDKFYYSEGDFIVDTVKLHERMLYSNNNLKTKHPFASPWWQWPLMRTSFLYKKYENAKFFFVGNPVVWWGTSLVLLIMLSCLFLSRWISLKRLQSKKGSLLWVPVVGYLISYLPYALVRRELFLYHYLPSLVFAIIAVVLWLDQLGWTRQGKFRSQRLSYHVLLPMIVAVFILISPFTYGLKVSDSYESAMISILRPWKLPQRVPPKKDASQERSALNDPSTLVD